MADSSPSTDPRQDDAERVLTSRVMDAYEAAIALRDTPSAATARAWWYAREEVEWQDFAALVDFVRGEQSR